MDDINQTFTVTWALCSLFVIARSTAASEHAERDKVCGLMMRLSVDVKRDVYGAAEMRVALIKVECGLRIGLLVFRGLGTLYSAYYEMCTPSK